MTSRPQEIQTRACSETKVLEIHRWVSGLAVPPEIVRPVDWYIVLATTLDSTNPVGLSMFMHGFVMTLQAAVVSKALVANVTTRARDAVVLRACCCSNQGRAVGLLRDLFPRVGGIWYGRVRDVVGSKAVVAGGVIELSTKRTVPSEMDTVGTLVL